MSETVQIKTPWLASGTLGARHLNSPPCHVRPGREMVRQYPNYIA